MKKLQDKTEKLQTYDSIISIRQSYFCKDGTQLYLIFQTLYYIPKRLDDTEKIVSWKSKNLSSVKFTTLTTTDNSLSPSIKWYENTFSSIFKGSWLKQKHATYTPPSRIFFIVYELDTWFNEI